MTRHSAHGVACACLATGVAADAIAPTCRKPLIVILVPSQDNPFFKAEADAAAARAHGSGLSRARRRA